MLPAFSCISWACAFRAGYDASIFFSGPFEAEGGTSVLSRRTCSSGISWRILSLMKKTLRRHRAGFELQCASSFVSSQVDTLPKAKSKTRSKQNKDMHKCSSVYSERGVPLPVLTSGGELVGVRACKNATRVPPSLCDVTQTSDPANPPPCTC